MATKKTDNKEEAQLPAVKEETGVALSAAAMSVDDLMAPTASSAVAADEAGMGSEDVGAGSVILPRLSLLQGLSKACGDELPGAKQGCWWITPTTFHRSRWTRTPFTRRW